MTAAALAKPGLSPIPRTQLWWEAVERGELLIQRCASCGSYQFYPRVLCTRCWSEDLGWVQAIGSGRIWTFTVVRMPGHAAWAPDVPYVIALIELDEGPRMMSRVVDSDPREVRVGQRVRVNFRRLSPSESELPVFVVDAADGP